MNPVRYILIHEFMEAYLREELRNNLQGSLQDILEKEGYEITFADKVLIGYSGSFYKIYLESENQSFQFTGNATIHAVS